MPAITFAEALAAWQQWQQWQQSVDGVMLFADWCEERG